MKPGNVIVTPESQVKILDFGLAKLVERAPGAEDETQTQEAALTEAGTVMGTVAYMSPEQASGKPLDHRTDIFSLGVMLYEMLAGTRPFRGKSQVETMHAIIHDPAPPLESVPPRLEEILEKALEKDPKDRYQHAGDLALDLRRVERNAGRKVRGANCRDPANARQIARAGFPGRLQVSRLQLFWELWSGRGAARPAESPFGSPSSRPTTPHWCGAFRDTVLSPDGKRIALVLKDASGTNAIWVRPLDSQERGNRWDRGRQQYILVAGRPVLGFLLAGQTEEDRSGGGPAAEYLLHSHRSRRFLESLGRNRLQSQ